VDEGLYLSQKSTQQKNKKAFITSIIFLNKEFKL